MNIQVASFSFSGRQLPNPRLVSTKMHKVLLVVNFRYFYITSLLPSINVTAGQYHKNTCRWTDKSCLSNVIWFLWLLVLLNWLLRLLITTMVNLILRLQLLRTTATTTTRSPCSSSPGASSSITTSPELLRPRIRRKQKLMTMSKKTKNGPYRHFYFKSIVLSADTHILVTKLFHISVIFLLGVFMARAS